MVEASHVAAHYLRDLGWPLAEIASALGCPEEAVTEWLSRPLPEE